VKPRHAFWHENVALAIFEALSYIVPGDAQMS
jgi:hypothetical protein